MQVVICDLTIPILFSSRIAGPRSSIVQVRGGHVLEVVLQRATIQIDDMTALSVKLPNTAAFYALNLTNNS
jgi:hypothetical protein